MKVPLELISLIEKASPAQITFVIEKLGIKFAKKKATQTNKEYLLYLCRDTTSTAVKQEIANAYKCAEPALTVVGCLPPPSGTIANIIDAIFCAILGNTVGVVFALLSLAFPFFKLGKCTKLIAEPLLKTLDASMISKLITKLLNRIKTMNLPVKETMDDLFKGVGETGTKISEQINNRIGKLTVGKNMQKGQGIETKQISNKYLKYGVDPQAQLRVFPRN